MQRISGTVELFPEHNRMPGISNQKSETDAALDLIKAISNPAPAAPFVSIGDSKLQEISQLWDIFKK